jgi:protein-S-isoprenylcysteine O-methyltransferase Ste14
VRHPIYAGLLLAGGARAVGSGNRLSVVACAALGGLLRAKAGFEERHLTARFPDYPAYAARTPRFMPRLGPGAPAGRPGPDRRGGPPRRSYWRGGLQW